MFQKCSWSRTGRSASICIIKAVDERIYRLKPFVKCKESKPVLKNDSSVACLEDLQQQFVIVPIDKASNNIAFVCKAFYIK